MSNDFREEAVILRAGRFLRLRPSKPLLSGDRLAQNGGLVIGEKDISAFGTREK